MTRVIMQVATFAVVTAYSVGDPHTPSHGITASGRRVEPNVTVAADTRYHPFGTYVDIDGVGRRRVDDTGPAIKGRDRFDVYMVDVDDAIAWGRRRVAYSVVSAPVLSLNLYRNGRLDTLPGSLPKNVIYGGPSYPKQISYFLATHSAHAELSYFDNITCGKLCAGLSFALQYPILVANWSSRMIPCAALDDTLNCALPASKTTGNRRLAFPRLIGASHLQDITFGEVSVRIALAFKDCITSLCNHIGRIIGICAKPQVIGVDAISNIAGMANMQTGRNIPFSTKPRKAMRQYVIPANTDSSISITAHVTNPSPAIAVGAVGRAAVNARPKILGAESPREASVLSEHDCSPDLCNYSRSRTIHTIFSMGLP